jgi:hypothetical protein
MGISLDTHTYFHALLCMPYLRPFLSGLTNIPAAPAVQCLSSHDVPERSTTSVFNRLVVILFYAAQMCRRMGSKQDLLIIRPGRWALDHFLGIQKIPRSIPNIDTDLNIKKKSVNIHEMARAYSSTGQMTDAYKILVGKLKANRLFCRSRRWWKDNTTMRLREMHKWHRLDSSGNNAKAHGGLLRTVMKFHCVVYTVHLID